MCEPCRQGEKIVQELMNNWSQVAEWWMAGATGDLQGLAVLLLTKVLLVDSKVKKKKKEREKETCVNEQNLPVHMCNNC